jgi:hypothetical protein
MHFDDDLAGCWVGTDGPFRVLLVSEECKDWWRERPTDVQCGYVRSSLIHLTIAKSPLDSASGWWLAYSPSSGIVSLSKCRRCLESQVDIGAFYSADIEIGFVRPRSFDIELPKI